MVLIRSARPDEGAEIEALLKGLELFHPGFTYEEMILAEEEGKLVGIANVRSSGGYHELTHVGVLPAYRNRGIAKQLIDNALRKTHGPVYLNTVVPLFFEHLGFERTDLFPRQFNKPEGWCMGCEKASCTSMVRKGAV